MDLPDFIKIQIDDVDDEVYYAAMDEDKALPYFTTEDHPAAIYKLVRYIDAQ